MPWMTLDFKDPQRVIIPRIYQVQAIPKLIPIDNNGKELAKDLAPIVLNMPEIKFGEVFQVWENISLGKIPNPSMQNLNTIPPVIPEINFGELPVVDNKGNSASFKNAKIKVRALYFSAHWCPPCRNFTPRLVKFYDIINKSLKRLEIVFSSWDRDEKSFQEYFKEMPWIAVDFKQLLVRNALTQKYGIRGIPALIIIDENGKVLDAINARNEVEKSDENQYEKIFEKWMALQ